MGSDAAWLLALAIEPRVAAGGHEDRRREGFGADHEPFPMETTR